VAKTGSYGLNVFDLLKDTLANQYYLASGLEKIMSTDRRNLFEVIDYKGVVWLGKEIKWLGPMKANWVA